MREKLFLTNVFWDQIGSVEEHSQGGEPAGLFLVRTAGITDAPLKDFLFTGLRSAREYMFEKNLYKYVYAVQNFSPDPEPIEVLIKRRLISLNLKLATAESCTAGLIPAIVTSVPGSSEYFERGFVTYSIQSKIEVLEVPVDELASFGAVSEAVAASMAVGALRKSNADVALSVTCTAGPTGEPPGVGYFGFAVREGKFFELFPAYQEVATGEASGEGLFQEGFVVRVVKKELRGARHFNRLAMAYSALSFLARFSLLAEMLRHPEVGAIGGFLFGEESMDPELRIYRNLEELLTGDF